MAGIQFRPEEEVVGYLRRPETCGATLLGDLVLLQCEAKAYHEAERNRSYDGGESFRAFFLTHSSIYENEWALFVVTRRTPRQLRVASAEEPELCTFTLDREELETRGTLPATGLDTPGRWVTPAAFLLDVRPRAAAAPAVVKMWTGPGAPPQENPAGAAGP